MRSWLSQRQTWVQPSHTVPHPLSSSQRHDFVVVMATTAHSYLTNLPWDKLKEMKERVFLFFFLSVIVHDYVRIIVNCGWSLTEKQGALCKPHCHSYALEVKISLCRRCEVHFSHLLSAGA